VRNTQIQEEFAKRRAALQGALADTLERIAAHLGFQLCSPAPMLAKAVGAALNGLAFERAADPEAIPDEMFAEFVVAVLGCSIAVGEHMMVARTRYGPLPPGPRAPARSTQRGSCSIRCNRCSAGASATATCSPFRCSSSVSASTFPTPTRFAGGCA